jgi:hypothetical protein
MRTFDVMNQTNEMIDKKTDNLKERQRVEMGHPESQTEYTAENEGGWDCCGNCFETVYLTFHFPP